VLPLHYRHAGKALYAGWAIVPPRQ
jgi:hypothetical protein